MIFYKETMDRSFVRVADKVLNGRDFDYDDKISAIVEAKMMMEEVILVQKEEDEQYDMTINKPQDKMDGGTDGQGS